MHLNGFNTVLGLFILSGSLPQWSNGLPGLNEYLRTAEDWKQTTQESLNVTVEESLDQESISDLMGAGALLLAKHTQEFKASTLFKSSGSWTSKWQKLESEMQLEAVQLTMLCYGYPQDMRMGWTKFSGNPLLCEAGWHHATEATLQLPKAWPGQPADQSLARGTGPWEGQWLLFFNIGGWAVNGWGMAVADSLEPLKEGKNPFQIAAPYPLTTGNFGDTIHAPNDFLHVNGTWYVPCEAGLKRPDGGYKVQDSTLWTSEDLLQWENHGAMEGVQGHDPGMVYDGNTFHLFAEQGEVIVHNSSDSPTTSWKTHGTVLEVHEHTGDPDAGFFNNRWHLFVDDAPHRHYEIGYAHTTAEDFPRGWTLVPKIFGPRNPDQGHEWDEDTANGNLFGTGDPDMALEGTTLYLTHEWPVGIAWKELDVFRGETIQTALILEFDEDGDQRTDAFYSLALQPGNQIRHSLPEKTCKNIRFSIQLSTQDKSLSPLIKDLSLVFRTP